MGMGDILGMVDFVFGFVVELECFDVYVDELFF